MAKTKMVWVVLEQDNVDKYLLGVFDSLEKAENAVEDAAFEAGILITHFDTSEPWQKNGGKTAYTDDDACYWEIIPCPINK